MYAVIFTIQCLLQAFLIKNLWNTVPRVSSIKVIHSTLNRQHALKSHKNQVKSYPGGFFWFCRLLKMEYQTTVPSKETTTHMVHATTVITIITSWVWLTPPFVPLLPPVVGSTLGGVTTGAHVGAIKFEALYMLHDRSGRFVSWSRAARSCSCVGVMSRRRVTVMSQPVMMMQGFTGTRSQLSQFWRYYKREKNSVIIDQKI